MQIESMLALAGSGRHVSGLLSSPDRVLYTAEEQQLSVYAAGEIAQLIEGRRADLMILKLYPQRATGAGSEASRPDLHRAGVRREVALRIAADALGFFGPLHAGIAAQEPYEDLVLQRRAYTTAYPHILLDRYDFYDPATSDPLLGAWHARRIQNLRRETRLNRSLDAVLLAIEVSQALFPVLVR
jgi:hypothetical protein